jgi:hypothetical protein
VGVAAEANEQGVWGMDFSMDSSEGVEQMKALDRAA